MDKGAYLFDMDGVLNEAYRVQNYDSVAVAESYHPLCCAPGYSMYFLA